MNLSREELSLFHNVQDHNVGFNNSDKNYGPVLYCRDLYLKQCYLHLYDDKGTYEHTEKPADAEKPLILASVSRRLNNLVNDCFKSGSATESLASTLTKWTEASLERGHANSM